MIRATEQLLRFIQDKNLVASEVLEQLRDSADHQVIDQDPVAKLVDQGHLRYERLAKELSEEAQLPLLERQDIEASAEALSLVPWETAEEYEILPLDLKDRSLRIATWNPLDLKRFDELSHLLKTPVDPVVVARNHILEGVRMWRQMLDDASAAPPVTNEEFDANDEYHGDNEIKEEEVKVPSDSVQVTRKKIPRDSIKSHWQDVTALVRGWAINHRFREPLKKGLHQAHEVILRVSRKVRPYLPYKTADNIWSGLVSRWKIWSRGKKIAVCSSVAVLMLVMVYIIGSTILFNSLIKAQVKPWADMIPLEPPMSHNIWVFDKSQNRIFSDPETVRSMLSNTRLQLMEGESPELNGYELGRGYVGMLDSHLVLIGAGAGPWLQASQVYPGYWIWLINDPEIPGTQIRQQRDLEFSEAGERMLEALMGLGQAAQAGRSQSSSQVALPCTDCGGRGLAAGPMRCFQCEGLGTRPTRSGHAVVCQACNGSGRQQDHCRRCGGTGRR